MPGLRRRVVDGRSSPRGRHSASSWCCPAASRRPGPSSTAGPRTATTSRSLLAAAAVWSFRLAWQRQAKLIEAERDLSELAVQEERARIARDLHDILGHSLTVISVKAELAERLLDDDPVRAKAELEDLQRLSRDALADVRSTAQGIRGISLPGEIASARMALESAGIEPLLPTVADEVPSTVA